jgi:hypothetical protein
MGLLREVRHDETAAVEWQAIRERLAATGDVPVIRMIDGLPAFPDEVPQTTWHELRLALAGGMVTLRREPGVILCIIWSNADAGLQKARDRVCRACAEATGGKIQLDDGRLVTADEFTIQPD